MERSPYSALLMGFIFAGASHLSCADNASDVQLDAQARYNWIVHCQGCHRADGKSSGGGTPTISGSVGRFLSVAGGREYLARVPGVAFVSLPDQNVAELLNWMLRTYDRANLPVDFRPYSAEEVGKLRTRPLISTSTQTRRRLLQKIEAFELDREQKKVLRSPGQEPAIVSKD